jgi:hypothetical protein
MVGATRNILEVKMVANDRHALLTWGSSTRVGTKRRVGAKLMGRATSADPTALCWPARTCQTPSSGGHRGTMRTMAGASAYHMAMRFEKSISVAYVPPPPLLN